MGKFVEFFGPGVAQLSIADRATIANMCPEYGATAAFFPVDEVSIKYLVQTGKCRPVRAEALGTVHRTLRIRARPSASSPSALGQRYSSFLLSVESKGLLGFQKT